MQHFRKDKVMDATWKEYEALLPQGLKLRDTYKVRANQDAQVVACTTKNEFGSLIASWNFKATERYVEESEKEQTVFKATNSFPSIVFSASLKSLDIHW